jgi:SAM-dependent methyltransferase
VTALAPEELKACCSSAYASAAARFLLGDSFHPGGAALTHRLAAALGVGPGSVVADVACGPGTSAIRLAEETGCEVVGIDLEPPSDSGHPRVRFVRGDAEALPLPDGSVDGVLCECALCTFPDKAAAAREIVRVLRPGGRLALSDVTAVRERLPAELTTLEARVACIADARPLEEIAALFEDAGLTVETIEHHDEALAALLERVDSRLRLVGMLDQVLPVARGRELVAAARAALAGGALGYASLVARK